MRKIRAPLSLLLAILLLLPLLSGFAVNAADSGNSSETRYTQKIVAVVYDNSTSMKDETGRTEGAQYSLALLISMLDSRDVMKIFPMNRGGNGIPVDLTEGSDRNAAIQTTLSQPAISVNTGGTKTTSTKEAIEYLKSEGLTADNQSTSKESDKEYWLIILTDGQFDAKEDPAYQAKTIKDIIGSYPSLHTTYVSFGSAAIDIEGRSEFDDLPFFDPYCKVPATELPAVMQEISNGISGRYPLSKGSQFTVSDNTVTINLDKVPFAISSATVIAQGCGATVGQNDVSYTPPVGGTAVNAKLTDICTIGGGTFESVLRIPIGCSFKATPDQYLSGGKLVLTFSDTINSEYLAIYAEPTLDLSYRIEAEGTGGREEVTPQQIGSTMRPGDEIFVNYEVFDPVKKEYIDLKTVFGDVTSRVVYNRETYAMDEPIPLVKGNNELYVEVSVMDGAFTLRDTVKLIVQEDPSYYRVEVIGDSTVSGANPSTAPVFTVFLNNIQATKDQLADFHFTATLTTGSNGEVVYEKEVIPATDGTIRIPIEIETNKFDVYTVSLLVESPQYLPLTASHSVTYVPDSLSLTLEGDTQLSITQYDLKANTRGFTFALTANGQPFPLVNDQTTFKLTVGGQEITAEVTGNTLTFIPTDQNLNGLHRTPGDYEVKLELTSDTYPNLNTSVSASLTIIKTEYTVVPITGSNTTDIKPLYLKSCDAALFFSVQRDGIALTESEMRSSLTNGDFDIDADAMFTLFFLPADLNTDVRIVDGVAVLAVTVARDMNPYLDWHLSTLITTGNKPITVSYLEAEATQSFRVLSSNPFLWALRFLLMIAQIVWLIHLIPFVISLFVAKPIPRGTVVYLSRAATDQFDINVSPVKTVLLMALWILVRFLCPFLEFMDQKLWFQNPGLAEFDLSFNRKNGLHFTPQDPEIYFRAQINAAQRLVVNQYYNSVRNGQQLSLMEFHHQTPQTFSLMNYYRQAGPAPLRDDAICQIAGGSHYGIFIRRRDGSVNLSTVVVFLTF